MSTTDVNEFLLSGGVPALKYETAGTTHTGKIISAEVQQQREIDSGKPKYWDDGKPQMQIKVHLQTTIRDPEIEDDDGIRADYIRGNKLKAVQAAVRKAKAKLEPGGELTITYTGDGEQKTRGFNAPKLYTASYVPPGEAAVADVLDAIPVPAEAAEATRPPSIPAEQWDSLPPEAKAALAAALPQF
jgi:hypothetical protein